MVFVLFSNQNWARNQRGYFEVNWFERSSLIFKNLRFGREGETFDKCKTNAPLGIFKAWLKGEEKFLELLKAGEHDKE